MVREILRVEITKSESGLDMGQYRRHIEQYDGQIAQTAQGMGFVYAHDLQAWVLPDREIDILPSHFLIAYSGLWSDAASLVEHRVDLPITGSHQLVEAISSVHALYTNSVSAVRGVREDREKFNRFLERFMEQHATIS